MIAYLRGKLIFKSSLIKKDNYLIIDVNGVGYKVYVLDKIFTDQPSSAKAMAGKQDDLELYIFTQVAETALDLYGFSSQEELNFFELLISISGIGPKSAMDILRKAKVEDLTKAVQTGNDEVLSKVSGLGAKTAQKIVLGLKDKLGGAELGSSQWDARFGDAFEALIGLGYQPAQVKEALTQCQAEDVGERVKEALKYLSKN
ncbi:MAG: Holliday junction branch migration protein RuvA [Patescibacteria group bacterium]|jgi:Holliday junction DNA helicase RuvA